MINIKNSSGKNIGTVKVSENRIEINNVSKPLFIIDDLFFLKRFFKEGETEDIIKILYDEYTLTIGEIAAIFNISYCRANKWIKQIDVETSKKAGRRNSSYGKKFSQERCDNMVKGRKDDHKQLAGIPKTQEVKDKISKTLKEKYLTGELIQDPEKHRQNWLNGVYDNVDFGHGIGGYFYSQKNQKRFLFRSLLELCFFIKIEEDDLILLYEYEPLRIHCDNGSIYTPDFLIEKNLIELKSWKYIQNVPEAREKFEYKKEQAEKYCKKNNLFYTVIWDKDLNFTTSSFKKYLNNNLDVIEKYQIEFFSPERVGQKSNRNWENEQLQY